MTWGRVGWGRAALPTAAGLVAMLSGVLLGGVWISVTWALAGAGLVWLGFVAGAREGRWGGLLLLVLTGGRLLVWETFPELFGQVTAGPVLRGVAFGLAVSAVGLSAGAYHRFGGGAGTVFALAGAAAFLLLWYITLEIALAFDGSHSGRVAGHEGLAVAAAWGLFGLAMAAAERRRFTHPYVRNAARLVLAAALAYLTLGAIMANARWAMPAVRYFAYGSVLGSIWAAEYMFRRYREDLEVNGILSLAAVLGGFGVCAFEVVRWLEPVFILPDGAGMSLQIMRWRASTQAFWRAAAWGVYALGVMAAGVWLRVLAARLLAAGLFGLAFLAVLPHVLFNPAASPWVRGLAFLAVVPGAGLALALARRAPGERGPCEAWAMRLLGLGAAGLAVVWGALELWR